MTVGHPAVAGLSRFSVASFFPVKLYASHIVGGNK